MTTGILLFDFELFIGERFQSKALILESIAVITSYGYNTPQQHLYHFLAVDILSCCLTNDFCIR
jgi:hypothetical protein